MSCFFSSRAWQELEIIESCYGPTRCPGNTIITFLMTSCVFQAMKAAERPRAPGEDQDAGGGQPVICGESTEVPLRVPLPCTLDLGMESQGPSGLFACRVKLRLTARDTKCGRCQSLVSGSKAYGKRCHHPFCTFQHHVPVSPLWDHPTRASASLSCYSLLPNPQSGHLEQRLTKSPCLECGRCHPLLGRFL